MIITKSAVDFFAKLQYNKRTRKTYRAALSAFIEVELTAQAIQEVALSFADLSEATIAVRKSVLTSFVQYLSNTDGVDTTVLNSIIWPRGRRSPRREPATEEDVKALQSSAYTPREAALIAFLCGTGLRMGSLILIKVGQVKDGVITVDAKGDSKVTTFVTENMLEATKAVVSRHKLSDSDFVFATGPGRTPTYKQIYLLFNNIAQRAEVNIVPHQLRHEYATRAINKGVPVDALSALLGHRSITSTMIYVHRDEDDLRKNFTIANEGGTK